ncbi:aspartate carbamoyltransferase [Miniphocaeibacter massiliensis]|uniref:aspartate carbamoyltransferase n=1 Tax=Miniphocaeibacter massiliensis TaxID=2041841 RepID=UPI000C06EE2A|nr:aspartate carbamoyltransferase [Miniphocaeibacter massiliensis]
MLKGKNLIEISDFSHSEIMDIMLLAQDIIKSPENFSNLCNGKILGTLFFEPSTRTRLSFESAIHRLGGDCIGFSESNSSSTSKGESLADTIKTVSSYVDIITMRHPKEGSSTLAKDYTEVPLINAGDGGHQHPTQTLTDMLTILESKKTFENLTIGLCGDLMFGRTVHSLVKAMSEYKGNKFVFISPEELKIPEYIKYVLEEKGIEYIEEERLENVIDKLDILYMTRVQKERFFNEEDYIRLKDSYILDKKKLKSAKEDLAILHPLPRVNEISVEVDSDSRALYFDQVKYGVIVRMALILKLLGVK